jgi:hypothetical protein
LAVLLGLRLALLLGLRLAVLLCLRRQIPSQLLDSRRLLLLPAISSEPELGKKLTYC